MGAYLGRQRSRLGAPKAITAAAHKLARIVCRLMRFGEAYVKQTEEAYAEQVEGRQGRRTSTQQSGLWQAQAHLQALVKLHQQRWR